MMKSIKKAVVVGMLALGIGFGIVTPAVAAPGNDVGYNNGVGGRFNDSFHDRAQQRRQNADDRDDRRARQERQDQALADKCAQSANASTVECQRYFQGK